jgi:hypothetical protein
MNLKMGSETFIDVNIPVLWGTRAVLQDKKRRLSVIDLSSDSAKLEIVGDEPAPGIEFTPIIGGFEILSNGKTLYSYSPTGKTLTSVNLDLPECHIGEWSIHIGSNTFSSNTVIGYEVGIAIRKDGISLGARLPAGLAKLVI